MENWHLLSHLHAKNVFYALWSAALAFIAPIGVWLLACAFMVVADFITGLWAARVKGEMWTSNKMRQSISKCGAYLFVIICARVFEQTLPSFIADHAELGKVFTACIVGVEFYSVLENFYKATGLRVFYILTQITNKKLGDVTGHKVKDNEKVEKTL